MTTLELDTLAETHIRDHGGIPNFQLVPGYRHTLCTSVNEEIVARHPGLARAPSRATCSRSTAAPRSVSGTATPPSASSSAARQAGRPDDVGAHRGHRGLPCGPASPRCAWARACTPWARPSRTASPRAVGAAAGSTASSRTTSATASAPRCTWTPRCPTTGSHGKGPKVVDGTTICIEPMVALGDQNNIVLDDEWTVATRDRSRAAHWEHSVAATAGGAVCADRGRRRQGPAGRAGGWARRSTPPDPRPQGLRDTHPLARPQARAGVPNLSVGTRAGTH